MQITIVIHCRGCGLTLLPVPTDTAWLNDKGLDAMANAIVDHRFRVTFCPYYTGPTNEDLS